MIAVLYDPADGRIIQTVQGDQRNIAAAGLPYAEVEWMKDDYDVTHQVVDGEVVPK